MNKKQVSREELQARAEQHVGRLVSNMAEGYDLSVRGALELVHTAVLDVSWTLGSFEGSELAFRVSDREDKRKRDAQREEKAPRDTQLARAERLPVVKAPKRKRGKRA